MSKSKSSNEPSKILAFDRDVEEIATELEELATALRDGKVNAVFFAFQQTKGELGKNWLVDKGGFYLQFLGWLTLHFWRFTEVVRDDWAESCELLPSMDL